METVGPRIALIGTVHRDPACHERLRGLLERLRPDLVTVEVSPFGIRFRQLAGGRLARRLTQLIDEIDPGLEPESSPAIRSLLALLALPDEYSAALDHARAMGDTVPVVPVDRSDLSERKLALIETEVLTRENLRALLERPPEEIAPAPEAAYARARAVLEGRRPTPLLSTQDRDEMESRDRHVAQRILALIDALAPARVAHICGWEHLVTRERQATLRALLADIPHSCALLDEAPPRRASAG